jgi:hypothetical protein
MRGASKRTIEKIEEYEHIVLPGTAEIVDAYLVDGTGKYRPEWRGLQR